jgi:hypothetical protein
MNKKPQDVWINLLECDIDNHLCLFTIMHKKPQDVWINLLECDIDITPLIDQSVKDNTCEEKAEPLSASFQGVRSLFFCVQEPSKPKEDVQAP